MRKIYGNVLNDGNVTGEAIVFDVPFSFIGDLNPDTGAITMSGHENFGKFVKDKILVIPTSRGGTIAPYIAYHAKVNNVAPVAILCNVADTITLECALTIDIPIMDNFNIDITKTIATGDTIIINTENGYVEM